MEKVIDLIRSAGDGAYAIDRLQRIVFWNDACERIMGFRADEILGKKCYDVFSGTAANGCAVCKKNCAVLRTRESGQASQPQELIAQRKDGKKLWLSVGTLHVPAKWNELSVVVNMIHDISHYKRIESLVEKLTQEVAQPNPSDNLNEETLKNTKLTEREREVIVAMSSGKTSSEIADILHISTATVNNHVHHILTKLGARNRLEAVVQSLRAGLL